MDLRPGTWTWDLGLGTWDLGVGTDMGNEMGAILIVPLIAGFVEALKRAGLPRRYAALIALASGVCISVGAYIANGVGARDLYDAVLQGIAFGLASAGLYSVARSAERTARQRPIPLPLGEGKGEREGAEAGDDRWRAR